LDAFFTGCCRDVEPGTDNVDWEYQRVWANHASVLDNELDMVCPRPNR
jgi:hypothetical protein